MRTVIQRVEKASVSIGTKIKSSINYGLLIFLGIEETDSLVDIEWLCSKIVQMRIFPDESNKMNLCLLDVDGDVLVISQFTLHASTKKGNRPSFIKSARPEIANDYYIAFIKSLSEKIKKEVFSGEFGADMKISLINTGPVTIFLDSKNKE